jgi:hypothetical protein
LLFRWADPSFLKSSSNEYFLLGVQRLWFEERSPLHPEPELANKVQVKYIPLQRTEPCRPQRMDLYKNEFDFMSFDG